MKWDWLKCFVMRKRVPFPVCWWRQPGRVDWPFKPCWQLPAEIEDLEVANFFSPTWSSWVGNWDSRKVLKQQKDNYVPLLIEKFVTYFSSLVILFTCKLIKKRRFWWTLKSTLVTSQEDFRLLVRRIGDVDVKEPGYWGDGLLKRGGLRDCGADSRRR